MGFSRRVTAALAASSAAAVSCFFAFAHVSSSQGCAPFERAANPDDAPALPDAAISDAADPCGDEGAVPVPRCDGGLCPARTETAPFGATYLVVGASASRYFYSVQTAMMQWRILARHQLADEQWLSSPGPYNQVTSNGERVFGFSAGTTFSRGPGELTQDQTFIGTTSSPLFALSSTSMFASDRARIFERPLGAPGPTATDGSMQHEIATDPVGIAWMAASAHRLWYIAGGDAMRRPQLGSWGPDTMLAPLTPAEGPHSISAAGDVAVFLDSYRVQLVHEARPTTIELLDATGGPDYDGRGYTRTATDGRFVFWFHPEGSPDAGAGSRPLSLMRRSLCSGRVDVLAAPEAADATGLAVTRDRAYWFVAGGPAGNVVIRSTPR